MNLLKIIYLNVFHQTAEAASFGVVQILTAYAYVRTIDFSTWWKDQIFLFFGFKEAQWRRRLILQHVSVSFMDSLLQLTVKTVVVGSS